MYRFLVTPKWIGFHLLVLLGIVTMVNLGLWQLRRLDEKQHRNDVIAARIDQPSVDLDTLLPTDLTTDDAALSDAEWRSINASGTYLPDESFVVVNRSQGGVAGDMTVTPLQLGDGRILLVERGFVPIAAEGSPAPAGAVEISGRLRVSQRHAAGQLSNAPTGELTEVQRFDIARLAEQLPAPVVPMYVELTSSKPAETGPYPTPVEPPVQDSGPHLSYAIQWFVFSICVAVGWVLAVRRSLGARQAAIVADRAQ